MSVHQQYCFCHHPSLSLTRRTPLPKGDVLEKMIEPAQRPNFLSCDSEPQESKLQTLQEFFVGSIESPKPNKKPNLAAAVLDILEQLQPFCGGAVEVKILYSMDFGTDLHKGSSKDASRVRIRIAKLLQYFFAAYRKVHPVRNLPEITCTQIGWW